MLTDWRCRILDSARQSPDASDRGISWSPLTLSHDVNNDGDDQIWDLITNTEVLEVNQAYLVTLVVSTTRVLKWFRYGCSHRVRRHLGEQDVATPAWQHRHKPIGSDRVAVLLMNSGDDAQSCC